MPIIVKFISAIFYFDPLSILKDLLQHRALALLSYKAPPKEKYSFGGAIKLTKDSILIILNP